MWLTGPVAPRHVGSSQTRAQTRVPCIGRRILNHCATREALKFPFYRPGNRDSGSFSHLLGVIQLERGTAEIQTQVWLAPVPKLYLGIKQGLPAPSHLGRKGATVPFTGKGLQALTQSSPSQAWQPELHGAAVPTTPRRLKRSQASSPAPAPVSTQDRGLS